MAKRKGKPVSFDAMVKFFMSQYNIPSKRDMDRIMARLDHIERLITQSGNGKTRRSSSKGANRQPAVTASDTVLEVIGQYKDGVGFADIQINTGFAEKKLRNIIFRLHKMGKIKRKNRGIYVTT